MPGPMVSQAKQQLKTIIDAYLTESDVERVLATQTLAKKILQKNLEKPFPNWSMASPNLVNPAIKNIIKPLLSEKFCKPHYKTHVSLLLNWLTAITT